MIRKLGCLSSAWTAVPTRAERHRAQLSRLMFMVVSSVAVSDRRYMAAGGCCCSEAHRGAHYQGVVVMPAGAGDRPSCCQVHGMQVDVEVGGRHDNNTLVVRTAM